MFECGCDVRARREAWKFLLGMHPRAATGARRAEEQQQRASDYRTLRTQWSTISDHQAKHNTKWREVSDWNIRSALLRIFTATISDHQAARNAKWREGSA